MELLAPVGNAENLIAAVAGGADAVYLGLNAFNARAKAENFSAEGLKKAVEFAHLHGVRVHVAMNTLLKPKEIPFAVDSLKAIEESGADAIIIADIGMLELAKKYAPSPQYHASTQCGVHNLEGARFLKRLGFDRIVLARETAARDITDIKERVDIELEYFVHGALCVAFSGNCYMSSLAGGNSGNRGQCLQFCRKQYASSLDGKRNYALSLKDQCLLKRLGELKSLGIDSLKIEGRLKSKGYVYSVTHAYRRALNNLELEDRDIYALNVAFNRGGFTEGHIFGDPKNIVYPHIQSNMGYRACKIIRAAKIGREYALSVDDNSRLRDGLGVKVIDNGPEAAGFKLKMRDGKIIADKPYRGYIHITSDPMLGEGISVGKIAFNLTLRAAIGGKASITAKCGDIEAESVSEFTVDKALTAPNTSEELVKQLSKFGGTELEPRITLEVDRDAYIPNKVLAELRRDIADKLKQELLKNYAYPTKKPISIQELNYKADEIRDVIAEIDKDAREILTDKSLVAFTPVVKLSNYSTIRQNVANSGAIYIKLPVFASGKTVSAIRTQIEAILLKGESIGIFADNYYALELAHEYALPVIGGFLLNIANDETVKALKLVNFCASVELSRDELPKGGIAYAYGRFPIMTLLHCPVKNALKCDCGDCRYKEFAYSNDFGEFKVSREKHSECVFTVRNSACHNLLNERIAKKYLDLTGSLRIAEALSAAINGREFNEPGATTGAYYRRVK